MFTGGAKEIRAHDLLAESIVCVEIDPLVLSQKIRKHEGSHQNPSKRTKMTLDVQFEDPPEEAEEPKKILKKFALNYQSSILL